MAVRKVCMKKVTAGNDKTSNLSILAPDFVV